MAELGFIWWQAGMLAASADCKLELGRADEAEADAREGLVLTTEIWDRRATVYLLTLFAWAAAVRGDVRRAGQLWGAVEAEAGRAPVGQWEAERELYAGRVLTAAGPELTRAREEGRRWSLERAVEEALAAS